MYIIYNSANVVIGYTADKKVAARAEKYEYYVEEIQELTMEMLSETDNSSKEYASEVLHAMIAEDPEVGYYRCVFERTSDGKEIRLCFVLGCGWKDETLEWLESVCEKVGFPSRYISCCGSTSSTNYIY